ncbi:MAG: VTT domain-containing protein [Candidatus Paceibacterota bacterium]
MTHLLSILDPKFLITAFGTFGVLAIIFMETGLFFGFFLPGDSLLFTAGFFASQGYLPIAILLVGAFIAAVAGDSVGYAFGKRVGPSLFTRENSLFFDKKHIARAQHFYEKHGAKTIVLARFIPIVRTFAPIVAGIGNMKYRTFATWNILGGFLWTWLMLGLGYTLGAVVPNPDRYVLPAVIVIIATSALPALREIFRKRVDMGN